MRIFLLAALLALPLWQVQAGDDTVVLGDSLSAEYDSIGAISGFTNLPTAYADITVSGWESMSWVEVLAELRPGDFDFGGERGLTSSWGIPRLSGFEYNWGIPGSTAAQYEDFISSLGWFFVRQDLRAQLEGPADRVVIWLGANEFRGNYGNLYDGGSSASLINGLIDDLSQIIDYVKDRKSGLQIVLANIPDIGATPSKIAAHPDPAKRALVTAATVAANQAIAQLASQKQVALADVYAQSARLVADEPAYFGAIEIINDEEEDNDPHFHFTRDGLHPNTASQIEIARVFIATFNSAYGTGIPQITDAEALDLLGIDFDEPFTRWAEQSNLPADQDGPFDDPNGNGLTNLEEYTFPAPPAFANGTLSFFQDPETLRLVKVTVRYSTDLSTWIDLPPGFLVVDPDGTVQATLPGGDESFLRLRLDLIPPGPF